MSDEIKTRSQKPRTKTGPQKAKDTDETSRLSVHPSPNEPGPAEESQGKSDDERGQVRARARKGDKGLELHELVKPEGERVLAGEERRRVHDEAQFQEQRNTHRPTGVDTLKVDGEKVQTVVTPTSLDPFELTPSGRDTAIKDQLRADGSPEHADVPSVKPTGGEWAKTDVADELTNGPKPSAQKRKKLEGR